MRPVLLLTVFVASSAAIGCKGMSSGAEFSQSAEAPSAEPPAIAPPANAGTPGKLVGTELHIRTASGDELKVDGNGLFYRTATGNTLRIKGEEFVWTTPRGRMWHSGNELTLESTIDDPSKLRLASPGRNVSSISFNQLQAQGRQEELALISGGVTEDNPDSLGGQLKIFTKRENATDDAAMRLMGVISSAYTNDPEATVRWKNLENLGPFTETPYAP
ncbi:MAG TPA: hypothetical protein VFV50_17710 [Bdellovibrionales bacterium]|nr:hypothetical protein [Bdellovibrionales bacterium]